MNTLLPRCVIASVAAILVFAASTPVSADCSNATCSNVTITRVYLSGSTVRISTSGDETLLDKTICKPSRSIYLWLDNSNALFEEYYSAAIAAYISKSSVQVRVENRGDGVCHVVAIALLE